MAPVLPLLSASKTETPASVFAIHTIPESAETHQPNWECWCKPEVICPCAIPECRGCGMYAAVWLAHRDTAVN